MQHLPPTGWGDVVTREYLELSLHAQDARIDRRFAEVDARFVQVDARFGNVDARFEHLEQHVEQRLDAQVGGLRQEIISAKHEVLAVMRGEFITAIAFQTRTMIFTMIAALVGLGTIAFAVARFV